jgi:hypothetical protein
MNIPVSASAFIITVLLIGAKDCKDIPYPFPSPTPLPIPSCVPCPSPTPIPTPEPTPSITPEPCHCLPEMPCPPGQVRESHLGPGPCFCKIYGVCIPDPDASAPPYPDHCPKMICWKPQKTLFDPNNVKVGDKITIDSTEFFGVCLPRGRCNAEVNIVCGGRPCEDPRGVRWYQKSGPVIPQDGNNWKVHANESGDGSNEYGYQLQVKIPAKGTYVICVSILPDLRDALGKPVSFEPDAGRCTDFTVSR